MNINNIDINVLVRGRSVSEFFHRGSTFIEGRGGSNYEIEVRNRNSHRVEVVLSVDGLSVTDGKAAGPLSNGYLVDAGATVRVPGWTLDNSQVAAFAFAAEKGGCYVEQATGSPENKGVIGALVYAEKLRPIQQYRSPTVVGQPFNGFPPYYMQDSVRSYGPTMRGLSPMWNASGIEASGGAGPVFSAASVNSVSASAAQTANQRSFNAASTGTLDASPQSLGTAFGEATNFNTSKVTFDRADMIAMIVMYYDNLVGLKARGVPVERPRRAQSIPQAFPGMTTGCRPPEGWPG